MCVCTTYLAMYVFVDRQNSVRMLLYRENSKKKKIRRNKYKYTMKINEIKERKKKKEYARESIYGCQLKAHAYTRCHTGCKKKDRNKIREREKR